MNSDDMIFVYKFLLAKLLVVIMVPVTRLAEKILLQVDSLAVCRVINYGVSRTRQ
jgi:hypothetical protein